jgi:hypothetical protein
MCSIYANSAREAIAKLCTLPLLARALRVEFRHDPGHGPSHRVRRPVQVAVTRPRADADEGTVLVLTLGLSVVLLLLVAVVVDASAVILAKRGLSSAADGAAVAAAQRADRQAIDNRSGALTGRLPLDEIAVHAVVASYQQQSGIPGLRLSSRVDAGTLAVVDAYRTVRLPFGGWLGVGAVKVHAVARARSPVVP